MKHYEMADGSVYRAEACNEHGPWLAEVFIEPRGGNAAGRRRSRITIEDDELVDPKDGDEACDLAWKRFGLDG